MHIELNETILKEKKELDALNVDQLVNTTDPIYIVENLQFFKNINHQELVIKIIQNGYAFVVVDHLDKFINIDHKVIIDELIRNDEYKLLAKNIDKTNVNPNYFLKTLLEENCAVNIIHNAKKLSQYEQDLLAETLIKNDQSFYLACNMQYFSNPNYSLILNSLLLTNQYKYAIRNLDLFKDIDQEDVFLRVLRNNQDDIKNLLFKYISKFDKIDKQNAINKLLEAQMEGVIAANLEYFDNTFEHGWFVDILIKSNKIEEILPHIDKLKVKDLKKVIIEAINQKADIQIGTNIEKITKVIDKDWLSKTLLSNNIIKPIAENLNIFTKIDVEYLQSLLLEKGFFDLIAKSLWKYKNINQEFLAEQLIKSGNINILAENINHFEIDHFKIAKQLFDINESKLVIKNIKNFKLTNYEWIINETIDFELLGLIAQNIEYFKNTDHNGLLKKLTNTSDNLSFALNIATNIEQFKNIDIIYYKQLVEIFISTDNEDYIINNLKKFKDLDHQWFIDLLVSSGKFVSAVDGIQEFENINLEKFFKELTFYIKSEKTILQKNKIVKLTTYFSLLSEPTISEFIKNIELNSKDIYPDFIKFKKPETIAKLRLLSSNKINKLVRFCKTNNLYQALSVIVNLFDYKSNELAMTWEITQNEIISLINNNNMETALDLINFSEIIHHSKLTELINLKKSILIESHKDKKLSREKFTSIHCNKEIFLYYLHIILINKYPINLLPKKIIENLEEPIENLFYKVREYIITAVNTELNESVTLNNDNNHKSYITGSNKSIFNNASSEEIRLFFDNASNNFINKNFFSGSFGGKAWSLIAQLGKKFWSDDAERSINSKIFLLNIAVGIQHNGGSFFDKDYKRVIFDRNKLELLLDFEASNNHSFIEFLEFGLENQIISKKEYDDYILYEETISSEANKLPHQIDTNAIFHKLQKEKVKSKIEKILQNQAIPIEIKISISKMYNENKGFASTSNSFSQLGRLIRTMNISWNKVEDVIKYYKNGAHELFYFSIEGYDLAYWYINGELKIIKDMIELKNILPLVSKFTNNNIVKAQLGYIREGD